MTVASGMLGSVNGHSTVRNWSINQLTNPKTFVASNTNTGTGRRTGAWDWNGSFNCYGAAPTILPGTIFTFEGFMDTEVASALPKFSGSAIVDQIAMTINWGNQDIVAYSVNFSGNGELTEGTGGGADSSYPDAPSAALATAAIEDPNGVDPAVEIPDLTQLVLTLTAANQAYVNSSTKVGTKFWTKRKPGPKDWTIALTRQNQIGVGELTLDNDIHLTITVDADVWSLKWGKVGDRTNLEVDIEGGAITDVTENIGMNIAPYSQSALGEVNTPAGQWLPVVV